jgi:LuxR family maltose regulon positive regulatory protein
MHRGDVPAARRELVSAQRLRHLLTYALPYFAVQARIELIRVHSKCPAATSTSRA